MNKNKKNITKTTDASILNVHKKGFIFSRDDVEKYYSPWSKKMVNTLVWRHGDYGLAEDAVCEAFEAVVGLSGELRSKLTPRTEDEWYYFILTRADWNFMHQRAKNSHWSYSADTVDEIKYEIASVRDNPFLSESARDDRLADLRRQLEYFEMEIARVNEMAMPIDQISDDEFRKDVRELVESVCREQGVSKRHYAAFVDYVLDEIHPLEVAEHYWGKRDPRALYVVKNRVMKLLRHHGMDRASAILGSHELAA